MIYPTCQVGRISIHALREEGDRVQPMQRTLANSFLSTPSARRATTSGRTSTTASTNFYPRPPRGGRPRCRHFKLCRALISIHALREEGDTLCSAADAGLYLISIHALREEGDGRVSARVQIVPEFLSTPSARRATAKTERKHPAFVSLYTSLHKLQRDACKTNRKITPLLAQTAGIPVRSVPENHVCCRFALAGHQKISTLSWANSGCSPTCSTFVW